MFAAALFAVLSQPQAKPELWVSGNLKVTVDSTTGKCTVQRRNSPDSITFVLDSIYPVVVKKQDGISLRGTKRGKQVFTEITRHSDTKLKVVTTFNDQAPIATDQFCDEFTVSSTFNEKTAAPGFQAYWRTPFSLYRSKFTRLTVIPNLTHFAKPGPFAAILTDNKIGYQNATVSQGWEWNASTAKETIPVPSGNPMAKIEYYVALDLTSGNLQQDQLMVADQVWRSEADARRYRAYPQKVPMVIGAQTTLAFRQMPVEVDAPEDPLSDVPEGGMSRWWSADTEQGKIGGPAGQKNALFGMESNGMRVAWAMKSWGVGTNQTRFNAPAEMYVRLLLSSSPADGFATNAKGDEPATYDAPTPAAKLEEIATAFYALRWISEFPTDPQTEALTTRVAAVIKRIPATNDHPIALALLAATQSTPGVPAPVRSSLSAPQITMLANAQIPAKYRSSRWALEAYCALVAKDPAKHGAEATRLVNRHLLNQNAFDRSEFDRIASFGAFGSGSAEISEENADIASAIGRLAIMLEKPVWLDRSAFALRASHALWATLQTVGLSDGFPKLEPGLAFPGYGNERPNHPDPRTNFESAEGRYIAATWEVLGKSGGRYSFANGVHIGVDGFTSDSKGNLKNSLFANPLPFAKTYQEPTRQAGSAVRIGPLGISGSPRITSIFITPRENGYAVTASPGLTLPPQPDRLSGEFTFGSSKPVPAILGAEGFEAMLTSANFNSPFISFKGTAAGHSISGSATLPTGSPLRMIKFFPHGWARTADLRWLNRTATTTAPANALWMQGSLTTPPMTGEGSSITFTARGKGDCSVSILDAKTLETVARWNPGLENEKVTLELLGMNGKPVLVRIEDADAAGWIEFSGLTVNGLPND